MRAYIRSASAITAQNTFEQEQLLSDVINYDTARLKAVEPDYKQYLDPKAIRRMSRIVKMGLTTAKDALQQAAVDQPDAIVTGTAYGCLEDTGVFLRGMIGQQEQDLSPTAFIQSTHNTVGAQIALNLKSHRYNNTFVHKGFSFENALIDALLLMAEGDAQQVLAGAIDELTDDSFNILNRFDLYKNGDINTAVLYANPSAGTIAGEGSAFFVLGSTPKDGDMCVLDAMEIFYNPESAADVQQKITAFLAAQSLTSADINVVLTGKNGDEKTDQFIDQYTNGIFDGSQLCAYKHLFGEYPTVSGPALWLGAEVLKKQAVPDALAASTNAPLNKLLLINQYKNKYFSLMLLSAV
ncbi:beta-ketoacyl synthase-like protein [Mucilaginibacter yixingensis]|uniref:Beta-ketoacyl synthase-like protein n=1 Tax=Mucilaginibacter yixingensis TaxID=1295612 RepID=A0A2T5JD42_9SPHI|nr:beta-ketoacyl synthase chain length factor [Mucilaginibacter yixingensis]PTQ99673.1 beta-ketoacyl synthase-like protein [Mucilaginibacter yixingensis]